MTRGHNEWFWDELPTLPKCVPEACLDFFIRDKAPQGHVGVSLQGEVVIHSILGSVFCPFSFAVALVTQVIALLTFVTVVASVSILN